MFADIYHLPRLSEPNLGKITVVSSITSAILWSRFAYMSVSVDIANDISYRNALSYASK